MLQFVVDNVDASIFEKWISMMAMRVTTVRKNRNLR
jgi:hypothetical protein